MDYCTGQGQVQTQSCLLLQKYLKSVLIIPVSGSVGVECSLSESRPLGRNVTVLEKSATADVLLRENHGDANARCCYKFRGTCV